MSLATNLGIVIGVGFLLYVFQMILQFFGVTFYNNSITIFIGIWGAVLLLFFVILPRDYAYFKGTPP